MLSLLPTGVPKGQCAYAQGELLVAHADGFSNAEIAERLVVEPASVRRYVSRILAKTGLRDRVQVTVAWVRAKM